MKDDIITILCYTMMNEQLMNTTTGSINNATATTSNIGTAICHAVPCHISYTGPSSGVDIFFNPMEVAPSSTNRNNDGSHQNGTSATLTDSQSTSYQAAMIRGRGLLARCNDRTDDRVCGHVFQVVTDISSSSSSSSPPPMTMTTHPDSNTNVSFASQGSQQPQKYLQSIHSFDQYVEWYHEHQTSMIPNANDPKTRFHRAMEWIHTANCLHAPIPLPKEPSKESDSIVC